MHKSVEKFTKYGIIVLNRKKLVKKYERGVLVLKYQIFYRELEIGLLEVNEQGQHRYTVNGEAVQTIQKEVPLIPEMLQSTEWRDPIPFFEERIENGGRFDLPVIQYHTDLFRMVKVIEN